MKYSIILPYYKRPELKRALESFVKHYSNRKDYEVIIVEDSKNRFDELLHNQLVSIVNEYNDRVNIKLKVDHVISFNPCRKYNLGVCNSQGEYIILSSPEIIHESNILGGLDKELEENIYITCACKAETGEWYQHTKKRNALFHFCSVLSKKDYNKIGGFDESYINGIGFDDNNFLRRLIKNSIKIIPKDDLVTIHLEHDKSYQDPKLIEINRQLWYSQVKEDKF